MLQCHHKYSSNRESLEATDLVVIYYLRPSRDLQGIKPCPCVVRRTPLCYACGEGVMEVPFRYSSGEGGNDDHEVTSVKS